MSRLWGKRKFYDLDGVLKEVDFGPKSKKRILKVKGHWVTVSRGESKK